MNTAIVTLSAGTCNKRTVPVLVWWNSCTSCPPTQICRAMSSQEGWCTAGFNSAWLFVKKCEVKVLWHKDLYHSHAWVGDWDQGKLLRNMSQAPTESNFLKTCTSGYQKPGNMRSEMPNTYVYTCFCSDSSGWCLFDKKILCRIYLYLWSISNCLFFLCSLKINHIMRLQICLFIREVGVVMN